MIWVCNSDVSIIEIEDGTFTVLDTGGDTHLGGDDFDERIVEYAVAEFKKSDRIDLSRDPAAMGRLKEEAEKAKKELSSAPSAQLNLPFIAVGKDGPHHLDLSLSRPQFEMMTGDLLARTVTPVQNALRDAGISASQLGKVLLVGGSTRMPAVERQVRELLGCEPSHSLNPDECVAMGAAVQGGLLQGGGKLAGATGAAAQGLVLMDVTPLTLSIETLGGVATPLITRNSMIPTRKSQIFTTARPMQTSVEINVLQGERPLPATTRPWVLKLNGIQGGFSSKPQIEVTFGIDVNGVVKVSAKDLGTGREQNITITGSTNLSENEIQRAMADAAAYEAEDSRRKERLELHNQAEVLAFATGWTRAPEVQKGAGPRRKEPHQDRCGQPAPLPAQGQAREDERDRGSGPAAGQEPAGGKRQPPDDAVCGRAGAGRLGRRQHPRLQLLTQRKHRKQTAERHFVKNLPSLLLTKTCE